MCISEYIELISFISSKLSLDTKLKSESELQSELASESVTFKSSQIKFLNDVAFKFLIIPFTLFKLYFVTSRVHNGPRLTTSQNKEPNAKQPNVFKYSKVFVSF